MWYWLLAWCFLSCAGLCGVRKLHVQGLFLVVCIYLHSCTCNYCIWQRISCIHNKTDIGGLNISFLLGNWQERLQDFRNTLWCTILNWFHLYFRETRRKIILIISEKCYQDLEKNALHLNLEVNSSDCFASLNFRVL